MKNLISKVNSNGPLAKSRSKLILIVIMTFNLFGCGGGGEEKVAISPEPILIPESPAEPLTNPITLPGETEWAWMNENYYAEIGSDITDGASSVSSTRIKANPELFEYNEGAGIGYYYQAIDYSIVDSDGYIYAGINYLADESVTAQNFSNQAFLSLWLKGEEGAEAAEGAEAPTAEAAQE